MPRKPVNPIKGDARYSVRREYCGHAKPRWVARFCGEWIGQGAIWVDATMLCLAHADKREARK